MKLNKTMLFTLLLGAIFVTQQVFCGGYTFTNKMPSNIVDGKEQNVVVVKMKMNWLSNQQVNDLMKVTLADALTGGLGNLVVVGMKGDTVQQIIMNKPADGVSVELKIYPDQTERLDKLGVWFTDFSFDPSDVVIKGWYQTEYTGRENWKNIHIPAHQHWHLDFYPPAA